MVGTIQGYSFMLSLPGVDRAIHSFYCSVEDSINPKIKKLVWCHRVSGMVSPGFGSLGGLSIPGLTNDITSTPTK